MNSSDEKVLALLRRWYSEQSPVWLSSKIGGWSLAVSGVISELTDESLVVSFDTYVVASRLKGSLSIPFGIMSRQFFESAHDAPFEPPASHDGPMLSCLEFRYQGHNHFVICEMKYRLS